MRLPCKILFFCCETEKEFLSLQFNSDATFLLRMILKKCQKHKDILRKHFDYFLAILKFAD